jgi:hypothetical protein
MLPSKLVFIAQYYAKPEIRWKAAMIPSFNALLTTTLLASTVALAVHQSAAHGANVILLETVV